MDIIKPISLLLQALADDPEFSVYPWSLLLLKFCHHESNLKTKPLFSLAPLAVCLIYTYANLLITYSNIIYKYANF